MSLIVVEISFRSWPCFKHGIGPDDLQRPQPKVFDDSKAGFKIFYIMLLHNIFVPIKDLPILKILLLWQLISSEVSEHPLD